MIESTKEYQAAVTADARRIYLRAVVDLTDPDMIWGELAGDQAPWSKGAELLDKDYTAPAAYATLEPGEWPLDGTADIFPDDYQVPEIMGYCSKNICGEDGTFATPQVISQRFSQVDILQAFSLFFSTNERDGVPEDFTVEVLYNDQVFFSQQVTGNTQTALSFGNFTVYTPTAVRLTVTKWSLPYRRVRMCEIMLGIYEQWGGDMLASFTATQQGAVSCLTLPFGSVSLSMDNTDKRFEPRNKSGLFQSIEERQGLTIYIGIKTDSGIDYKPLGIFYQHGDGWKTSDNSMTMSWYLVDIIGLLSERTFIVPETLPTTLGGWMAAVVGQLGESFTGRYTVDEAYADIAITANDKAAVTGKKCTDIVRWACMAAGCWARADAETGNLTAEPLWNQGNKLTLDNLTAYPTMKANESLAALIFHLADGNKTEYVVSGNQTGSEKTVTIENPFLHTQAEALKASKLILACYGGNVIETTGRGDPSSEIGDVDTIWLDESRATTARRIMQSFNIQNGVLQGCQSKMLQADGSYLWTEYAVITESGTWTAPDGVTQLRIVLGAGGQGGSRGQDGSVGGSGNIPGSGVSAGEGAKGLDGKGGKIWYGVININNKQTFEVHLGKGGAKSDTYGVEGALGEDTTFGSYSSSNGSLYDTGYTDIANGQVFARTGVPKPLAGTGDGGAGGQGGEAGSGYWQELYWTQGDVDAGRHPGGTKDGRPVPAGTAGSESIVGKQKGWDFIVTKKPGKGKAGVDGATGFVMVTWEKVTN